MPRPGSIVGVAATALIAVVVTAAGCTASTAPSASQAAATTSPSTWWRRRLPRSRRPCRRRRDVFGHGVRRWSRGRDAAGRRARGRRRGPGRGSARDVHLGRWRVGQPMAARRACRRRDRRGPAPHVVTGPGRVRVVGGARPGFQPGRRRAVRGRRRDRSRPRDDPDAGCGGVDARADDPVRRPGQRDLVLAARRVLSRFGNRPVQAVAVAGSGEAEKIETWASSGSITPRTFWSVRRWTHEDQDSK